MRYSGRKGLFLGKQIGSLMRVGILLVLLLISVIAVRQITRIRSGATPTPTTPSPITGTFLMFDNSLQDSQVLTWLTDMQQNGIDTIIILGSSYLGCSPSYNEYYYWNTSPQFVSAVKYARQLNMKVFFGLVGTAGSCIHYWEGSPTDINTDQGRLIDFSARTARDLKTWLTLYFNDPGIWDSDFVQGFYIPQENGIEVYLTSTDVNYFAALSNRIKSIYVDKKLMVSPWMTDSTSTVAQAKALFLNFINQTKIDIIAPQDSVGTGKTHISPVNYSVIHYQGLAQAVSQARASGRMVEGWANVETFTNNPNGTNVYLPTNISSLVTQINSSKPYTSKLITWIYQHTLSTIPDVYSLSSWSGEYTYENAIRRQILFNSYIGVYYPTRPYSALYVFTYGTNLVVKGNLGTTGQQANIKVIYIGNDGLFRQVTKSRNIVQEDYQVVYIPLSSLTDFSPTNFYSALVIPPVSSTPTPTPTPTPKPSPTSTPIPTPTPIYKPIYKSSFIYGPNFVIKGSNFGQTGSSIPVTIEYSTQKRSFNRPTRQEDYQTLYIPLSSLPSFSQTSLLTITIGSTRVVFPKIIFTYYKNLVLKNAYFGQADKPVNVHIEYGSKVIDTQSNIHLEEQQVIYIPLTLLPGYVSPKLVWVSQ
jgi:hypothetical protein